MTSLRGTFARLAIVALTIAAVWGALSFRAETGDVEVVVGQPSPQRFEATSPVTDILDADATAAARNAAEAQVADVYTADSAVTEEVRSQIQSLIATIRANAVAPDPVLTVEIEPPVVPEPEPTTTSSTADGTSSSTTVPVPVETVTLTGTLFLDADGDGIYLPDIESTASMVDLPLADVDVIVEDAPTGAIVRARSDATGAFTVSVAAEGPFILRVDDRDPQFPDAFRLSTSNNPQVVEATPGGVTVAAIGFTPHTVPIEEQIALAPDLGFDSNDTTVTLVTIATEDVWRVATNQDAQLPKVSEGAVSRATQVMTAGIKNDELAEVRSRVLSERLFLLLDLEREDAIAAELAAQHVAAAFLVPNEELDEAQTAAARAVARAAVPDVTKSYDTNQLIVDAGEPVTQVQFDAINQLGLLKPTSTQYAAILAMAGVFVAVVMFYIARFRPGFWHSTRRVGLFGLLLGLLALAIRAAGAADTFVSGLEVAGGYAVPAAAFGFMVAILFDGRMAVLMAISAGAITAMATGDPGYASFALLSGIVPIPFVSSISKRADFGGAIFFSAVGSALIAAAAAFYFHAPPEGESAAVLVATAAAVAGVVTLLTTLAAGMAVSFFELVFDITTSLRLLDVTDRNHPALQLLQEEAWGTFNHSLMVGTLADKAAKAIGANNLLARAAAYYHDLGKTQNPSYFIENQFGISNPHDLLPPEESAEIIRNHVLDGVDLAKQYRIPSEVADGILCHHGDGIMRYFYERAKELYGEDGLNVADYRHAGHKPRTREMAILMMADALEGATRAVFTDRDPTPEAIAQVVDRVVAEKVNDGQLSESDLTLGDLTRVKAAFVDALVGHYHQRIPYPNFPGAVEGEAPTALSGPTDEIIDVESVEEDSVHSPETADGTAVIPIRRPKER